MTTDDFVARLAAMNVTDKQKFQDTYVRANAQGECLVCLTNDE